MDITKMSSKGQIVIPKGMRKNFKEGEKIVVIQGGNKLILKKVSDFDENLKEDLEFARRTEEAWKDLEKGNSTSYSVEEFMKRLER